jgi:hypothetical protein
MLYRPKLPDGTGVATGDNYGRRLSRHYSRVAVRLGRKAPTIADMRIWLHETLAAQALFCTKTGKVA